MKKTQASKYLTNIKAGKIENVKIFAIGTRPNWNQIKIISEIKRPLF